jgi:hypothetical protein
MQTYDPVAQTLEKLELRSADGKVVGSRSCNARFLALP